MTSHSRKEPISKVDTAWLRMEQPTNLMMITGIMTLNEGIDYERLVRTVEARFLSFRRFRQKAVDNARGANWELDEDFDIYSHVRRVALPGNADKAELEEYVSYLASTPLNKSRPLWQFHYIENYIGGPVVVTRIHHCYADGIALVQVMLTLTDGSSEEQEAEVDSETWKRERTTESSVFRRLTEPAREGIDFAVHWGFKLVEEGLKVIQEPELAGKYAGEVTEIVQELTHALTLSDDPKTVFKGDLGIRKEVAWTDSIALDEVKAISKVLGCTVNDVLIAAVTGALRRYMLDRGEAIDSINEIRATVPVNLRPLEHAKELGNHFGVVFLSLPTSESHPLRRVYEVSARMNELKNSKQATVALGLLAALGMGPAALQKPSLELLSQKASTVLTNVPGPREPLFLAGGEVRSMMFWVPQNGSIGMGVSILSYNGKVFFGVMTDRKIVPDPNAIIENFGPELERLLKLCMMLPLDELPCCDTADELLENSLLLLADKN
ncbi:MAG TPA: wax ester/triacylglycerol synthase family O-acyltransferase [Xanthomonadales bacterium]|nr:wax ester/triacylglycerol synthase family O-acyltransferase [Xanthomonadales bacterium]